MPLISVLIPCHNAAPWLQSAVESICRQTVRDLEIIIYNDGSSDESEAILGRLASFDERIHLMSGVANRGIVFALNAMLDKACGRFIARMDGDDISFPVRFACQIDHMQRTGVDLCGTWFQEFGQGISRAVRWFSGESELRAAMLFQNTICHPTVLAKREVFEKFRYRESYNLAEDYDLFARASEAFRLSNVPEVLLRYRRHPGQATKSRRVAMERVTQLIRIQALEAQGIHPSADQRRVHNLIRAPHSISSVHDLLAIETWLLVLLDRYRNPEAQRVIASQWTRAAVRAAPLGRQMWKIYRRSPLYQLLYNRLATDVDVKVLAALRLGYDSRAFDVLRRLGMSA